MLAILGHLVTSAGVRLPGEIAYGTPFAAMKTGLAAFDTVPAAGLAQTFLFIGMLEFGFNSDGYQEKLEQYCKDFELFSFFDWDEETFAKKTAIELNNGRAAQMGILALMVHEKLDNNPYMINGLLGFPVAFN